VQELTKKGIEESKKVAEGDTNLPEGDTNLPEGDTNLPEGLRTSTRVQEALTPPPPKSGASGRFLRPSGRFLRPSGRFLRPSGRFLRPSGRFLRPSGTFLRPSGTFLRRLQMVLLLLRLIYSDRIRSSRAMMGSGGTSRTSLQVARSRALRLCVHLSRLSLSLGTG
jgi:hypothetical protein